MSTAMISVGSSTVQARKSPSGEVNANTTARKSITGEMLRRSQVIYPSPMRSSAVAPVNGLVGKFYASEGGLS